MAPRILNWHVPLSLSAGCSRVESDQSTMDFPPRQDPNKEHGHWPVGPVPASALDKGPCHLTGLIFPLQIHPALPTSLLFQEPAPHSSLPLVNVWRLPARACLRINGAGSSKPPSAVSPAQPTLHPGRTIQPPPNWRGTIPDPQQGSPPPHHDFCYLPQASLGKVAHSYPNQSMDFKANDDSNGS